MRQPCSARVRPPDFLAPALALGLSAGELVRPQEVPQRDREGTPDSETQPVECGTGQKADLLRGKHGFGSVVRQSQARAQVYQYAIALRSDHAACQPAEG